MTSKSEFLKRPIEHVDITRDSVVPIVEAMGQMAYSARDLHRAATIYDRMLRDRDCGIILCLAGSLISAGLKKVFVDMLRSNMVDAIAFGFLIALATMNFMLYWTGLGGIGPVKS